MKKIALSLIVFLAGIAVMAQTEPGQSRSQTRKERKEAKRERVNQLIAQEEEGEIIFHKQNVFNVRLATDGYGIGYEFGRFKSNRKSTLFQLELSEKKHNKEKKQGASISQWQVNSVIPGKINNFYQLKLGVAQQQIIGGKSNKNGVAVAAIYGGGLSLGLLKPYFVDVKEGFRTTYDKIIDSAYIPLGASGFTVGWNELKIRPGAYAKTAMRFDYGRLNETVTAIEVGLSAEYYPQKVPQMLYNTDKQFFFSAYVSLLLGRRK